MKPLLLTAALFVTAQPLMAQDFQPAPKRGLNLARETAVASNGGLGTYHPARCMYASSVNNPCLRVLSYGYEYRFMGTRLIGTGTAGLRSTSRAVRR